VIDAGPFRDPRDARIAQLERDLDRLRGRAPTAAESVALAFVAAGAMLLASFALVHQQLMNLYGPVLRSCPLITRVVVQVWVGPSLAFVALTIALTPRSRRARAMPRRCVGLVAAALFEMCAMASIAAALIAPLLPLHVT
jgi:hypothetical protein